MLPRPLRSVLALLALALAGSPALAEVSADGAVVDQVAAIIEAGQQTVPAPRWVPDYIEERMCNRDDYDTPILGPIPAGSRPLCEDPPDRASILRALPRPPQGVPGLYEVFRDDPDFTVERLVDRIDPPRFYPLVGPAQLHHCHYKCTVYFTETRESVWPFPFQCSHRGSETVYIDRDHLHVVACDPETLASMTRDFTQYQPELQQPSKPRPAPRRKAKVVGKTQVRFVRLSGMKIAWSNCGPDGQRTYSAPPIETPGRYNFLQAAIYRLKLSSIEEHAGLELYPTLEVVPTNPKTEAFLAHNAVCVEFTAEDFQQVTEGSYVVKVIYLPDPAYQELSSAGTDEIVSTRLEPGADPIKEALRRGSILLVIRMGNMDQEAPNTPTLGALAPNKGSLP